MDSAIFESFMHPKMFKTKLVKLDSKSLTKNTAKKTESEPQEKKVSQKHKFKIL